MSFCPTYLLCTTPEVFKCASIMLSNSAANRIVWTGESTLNKTSGGKTQHDQFQQDIIVGENAKFHRDGFFFTDCTLWAQWLVTTSRLRATSYVIISVDMTKNSGYSSIALVQNRLAYV